jgi:8-oxo-dGTP pyrophosphatase MutT (NUDIX family)
VPFERSAGAVIIRREDGKVFYLLLKYPGLPGSAGSYWDLPKGNIEKGEKPLETARREVAEETGLTDIRFIEGFKEWVKYFYRAEGKGIFKTVTFFLAETQTQGVKISYEHAGYQWLPYGQALDALTFDNAKQILRKASAYLSTNEPVKGS